MPDCPLVAIRCHFQGAFSHPLLELMIFSLGINWDTTCLVSQALCAILSLAPEFKWLCIISTASLELLWGQEPWWTPGFPSFQDLHVDACWMNE